MSKLGDFLKNNGAKVAGLAVKGGLGALKGGPVGFVAALAEGIGMPGSDEEAVLAAAQADPNVMIKIKEFESTLDLKEVDAALKEREAELHTVRELYALDAGDRSSARQMYINTSDETPKHLTWLICCLWIGMAIAMFLIHIPPENRELIIRMQGTLEGAVATSIAFWLGSSAGSKSKTDIIKNQMDEDGK